MKKSILLSTLFIVICSAINAQEPEKKKNSPPPSNQEQERAINDNGVSVKSPKKSQNTAAKEIPASAPSSTSTPAKANEKQNSAKKPE